MNHRLLQIYLKVKGQMNLNLKTLPHSISSLMLFIKYTCGRCYSFQISETVQYSKNKSGECIGIFLLTMKKFKSSNENFIRDQRLESKN